MGAGLNTQQPPLPPGQRPVAPKPKPLPISKGGKPIFAPLPEKKTRGPAPRPPIDMVRDPGFGSAMDQRNYGNILNDIISSISAARGDQGGIGAPVNQGPQLTQDRLMGAPTEQQPGYGIDYIEGGQRYMPMTPTPSQMAQFQQGQQGAMASQPQIPQGQQMQDYQNLLQQGMQRSGDMNQAAQNFAAPAGPQKSFTVTGSNINNKFGAQKQRQQASQNFVSPSSQRLI
jgi:hypothetical protein